MAILGMELEVERMRGDDEDCEKLLLPAFVLVLKKEGKRAWAICMERTEDMVRTRSGN
jgi:hypothetical protein